MQHSGRGRSVPQRSLSMSKRVPAKRRSRLLALEPRVLFDGALADTAAAVPKVVDATAASTDATAADASHVDAQQQPATDGLDPSKQGTPVVPDAASAAPSSSAAVE